MIVRRLEEIADGKRAVAGPTFTSRRLLLAQDGLSYSLHDTVLYAGTTTTMWYQNHLESVYCIEGTGTLTDRETGQVHAIAPGTLYVLDEHDRHILHAESDLRMVCVFTPPLTGEELHDENGSYPLLTDEPAGSAS